MQSVLNPADKIHLLYNISLKALNICFELLNILHILSLF